MKKILFTTTLLLTFFSAFSQRDERFIEILKNLDSLLSKHSEKYPIEKIGLISDKTQYTGGENIWLTCQTTVDGSPTFVSKVVYIEFSDAAGKLVDKKMLPINSGMSSADIAINANWNSGVYYITAYTKWMLNFPELIFQKPIIIYNTDWLSKPIKVNTIGATASSIELFPEGGSFIAGSAQKAVVRIYSSDRLPVQTSFSLSEDGKEILTGATNEYGIAEINFEPKTGKSYIVKANTTTGTMSSATITPKPNSVRLAVDASNNKRIFVQAIPSQENNLGYKKLLLAGIMNNKVVYNGIIDFEEGNTAASIVKNKIPSGVIELFLIDQNENIVSSTKVYNAVANNSLVIEFNESTAANKISLSLPDSSTTVAQIGIYDKNESPFTRINKLTLIPELQSEHSVIINNLSDSNAVKTINQLLIQYSQNDNKLYTRLRSSPTLQYMVESGITISGTVKQYTGKPSLKSYEAELIILGEDSTTMFARAMTKEDGKFNVPDALFTKSAKVYFQAHNPTNKKELMDISLQPGYFDELKTVTLKPRVQFPTVALPTSVLGSNDPIKNKLEKIRETDPRYKELQGVVIKTKKLSRTDSLKQEYMSPMFDDGNTFIMEPEGNYFNIWVFIRGRVPGLKVEGDIINPTVYFGRYAGISNTGGQTEETVDPALVAEGSESIQFFLNEIPVSKDVISSLNLEDVALVTSNREPMPGLGASYGVISIYTKKGTANTNNTYKSMAILKRAGFSVTKNNYYQLEETDIAGKTIYHSFKHFNTPKTTAIPVLKNKSYTVTVIGWDKNNKPLFYEKEIK